MINACNYSLGLLTVFKEDGVGLIESDRVSPSTPITSPNTFRALETSPLDHDVFRM